MLVTKPHQFYQIDKYITGIIEEKEQKLLAINGIRDHIHICVGIRPEWCISELVRDIKRSSSRFINENNFCQSKFRWQSGFGVFSFNKSSVPQLIKYILNQKAHHNNCDFDKEVKDILEKNEIQFSEKYLFKIEEESTSS